MIDTEIVKPDNQDMLPENKKYLDTVKEEKEYVVDKNYYEQVQAVLEYSKRIPESQYNKIEIKPEVETKETIKEVLIDPTWVWEIDGESYKLYLNEFTHKEINGTFPSLSFNLQGKQISITTTDLNNFSINMYNTNDFRKKIPFKLYKVGHESDLKVYDTLPINLYTLNETTYDSAERTTQVNGINFIPRIEYYNTINFGGNDYPTLTFNIDNQNHVINTTGLNEAYKTNNQEKVVEFESKFSAIGFKVGKGNDLSDIGMWLDTFASGFYIVNETGKPVVVSTNPQYISDGGYRDLVEENLPHINVKVSGFMQEVRVPEIGNDQHGRFVFNLGSIERV